MVEPSEAGPAARSEFGRLHILRIYIIVLLALASWTFVIGAGALIWAVLS
ncbi:hypothetical protein [Devosia sp. RR2S18]|nr:hypothetical protein [Devosia sp. RR2S18]WIJ23901.1 hypothetical protein QOV41_12665 [Devosia sp. RR2S18]